ncbi:MAG: hypothetical protein HQ564_08295 [Candidatus Saganbacteria bacterium]|nr:hypothetical protein [Candidatus Saganbacteria bacterium]
MGMDLAVLSTDDVFANKLEEILGESVFSGTPMDMKKDPYLLNIFRINNLPE